MSAGLDRVMARRGGGMLVVVGADRVGRQAACIAARIPGVSIAIDKSGGPWRVLRLLRRGSLSVPLLWRMAWAEARRAGGVWPRVDLHLTGNVDLLDAVARLAPDAVLLFRAGLIVSREVLATGVPVLNIHCARVPEDGGIGSIDRALRAGRLDQNACLHRVTISIDEGEVIAAEPYRLDQSMSYACNEDAAYRAGLGLLERILSEWSAAPRDEHESVDPDTQRQ